MRIAVPVAAGRLAAHFGHCESFAVFDVDAARTIAARDELPAPPHEPGRLPRWLADRKVDLVIAGGMGVRARNLFAECGIEVIVGAPPEAAGAVVERYLAGTLETGSNVCDH